MLAGGLWIAGAIGDGTGRLVLWGAAVVATHTGNVCPDGSLAVAAQATSRTLRPAAGIPSSASGCFIVALGETVLTMGAAFSLQLLRPRLADRYGGGDVRVGSPAVAQRVEDLRAHTGPPAGQVPR